MPDQVTFKDLSRSKKMEHIWEYYKWHIIGTIIGVICLGSILTTVFGPRPPKNQVDFIITGILDTNHEILEQTKEAIYTSHEAGIYTLPADWSKIDASTMSNEQLLSVKIFAGECDVIAEPMMRYESFKQIEEYDVFAKLDEIPALESVLDEYEAHLMTGISVEDGEEYVYGIKIDALEKIEGITLYEDFVLSIMAVPNNMDAAVAFVKWLSA